MTPTVRHPRLTAALVAAGLGLPAGAHAADGPAVSAAPGRMVFAVDDGSVVNNVDSGGASLATPLPDGSTLLFGFGTAGSELLHIAKIGPNGTIDRTFGTGGVASLSAPNSGRYSFQASQVLRQADGKLLLVSSAQPPGSPPLSLFQLRVTRLNADATLDRSYGIEGTAMTSVDESCGRDCATAALQPDGALVLTGTTGAFAQPPATPNLHWAVTRLTPSGTVDRGFGSDGIATIAAAGSTRGFNVAIGGAGTIVASSQSQLGTTSKLLLTRLTSSGAPDATFAGGTPVDVPLLPGFQMLALDDGSIVLHGNAPGSSTESISSPGRLVRYSASGAPDTAFGSGGYVDLGNEIHVTQLLPAAGHAVLVVGGRGERVNVKLVTPGGTFDPSLGGRQGHDLALPFGGGGSSFLVSQRPRPVQSIMQNSFTGRGDSRVIRRVDGSYLAAGGVHIRQPTGEGAGFSIGRFAAAAFTPSLALDTSFGGRATAPRLSVRLSLQRASTARTRHGIRIQLKGSATGLARVKIMHGGRAIALSLLPVFKTTRHTLPVELTSYGNAYLRHHRNLQVSITATGRDLLANTATTTARGLLR